MADQPYPDKNEKAQLDSNNVDPARKDRMVKQRTTQDKTWAAPELPPITEEMKAAGDKAAKAVKKR